MKAQWIPVGSLPEDTLGIEEEMTSFKPAHVASENQYTVRLAVDGKTYDIKVGDYLIVVVPTSVDGENVWNVRKQVKVEGVSKWQVGQNKKWKVHFDITRFAGANFFIVAGYTYGYRYEIIWGTHTPNSEVSDIACELEKIAPGVPIPRELAVAVSMCNQILNNTQGYGGSHKMLQHPGMNHMTQCPKCTDREDVLAEIIIHLNDTHRLSREAIAEWLDTLDEQPVYYPKFEPPRVANSAKVVALPKAVQERPFG
jgi:hypothetical protein